MEAERGLESDALPGVDRSPLPSVNSIPERRDQPRAARPFSIDRILRSLSQ